MRFHDPERFEKYCVAKRRTCLRQLAGKPNLGRFFDLWRGEFDLSRGRFQVGGLPERELRRTARELRWLLLSDLHALTRRYVPDFLPAPPTVLEALPGGVHQVRSAKSMLITGEDGAGKEQLACLLHVLSGRPGTLVRIPARELGREGGPEMHRLLPERGSVFLRDLEDIAPRAQDELLAFLKGEARRRDLLFFASTRVASWDLAGLGVRRELLVRVSQTEIRLPRIATRASDIADFVGDMVFDQARVESGRMAALREEAERLATEWRSDRGIPAPQEYDFVSEALSYVLWREKARRAAERLDGLASVEIPTRGSFRAIADKLVRDGETTAPDREDRPAADSRTARESGGSQAGAFPTHLDRDGLLRAYYFALLDEENGDLRRVAERAGRKLRHLQAEFARLGVPDDRWLRQAKQGSNELLSQQAKHTP